MFKESNLAKVSVLKLLTKENSFKCFHQLTTFQQRRRIHRNFLEKSTCKQSGLFDHQNHVEKSKQKHRGYFDERNYIKKSTWKQGGFFGHQNQIEKSTSKQRGFLNQRNYLKKIRSNNADFLTIKIKSKRVRRNDVEFSISKIKSKKYLEMMWKFVEIWSPTYRRNIHVKSISIRRGVPVGKVTFFFVHTYNFCNRMKLNQFF